MKPRQAVEPGEPSGFDGDDFFPLAWLRIYAHMVMIRV